MMKHKILILDDDISRFSFFTKLIGNEYDSAYTAESLLAAIRKGEIVADTLMLDHDLGSSMNGTGMAKVIRDEKLGLPTVKRILIHSNNTVGGTNMLMILQEVFPDMTIKLFPTSQINDVWEELNRDKVALRNFILNIQ